MPEKREDTHIKHTHKVSGSLSLDKAAAAEAAWLLEPASKPCMHGELHQHQAASILILHQNCHPGCKSGVKSGSLLLNEAAAAEAAWLLEPASKPCMRGEPHQHRTSLR